MKNISFDLQILSQSILNIIGICKADLKANIMEHEHTII